MKGANTMKNVIFTLSFLFSLSLAQVDGAPVLQDAEKIYFEDDSGEIVDSYYYVTKPFMVQFMDPVDKPIVFMEIRDCDDSLIFLPYPTYLDVGGFICTTGYECPCSFYIALESGCCYGKCNGEPDNFFDDRPNTFFGLNHFCSTTMFPWLNMFYFINLKHIRRCVFDLILYSRLRSFSARHIVKYLGRDRGKDPPWHWLWDAHLEEIILTSICDTAGNCTPRQKFSKVLPNPQAIDEYYKRKTKYRYHLEFSILDSFLILESPETLWFNISNSCSNLFYRCEDTIHLSYNLFLSLDSTSAWMIISWDTGEDTIYYGDPGTFWFQPPDKHIGWRQFGVLTDSTNIPSSYTGKIKVCLMDVTNAPVVAFGEPTHLHPTDKCCYDDYTYIDTTYGDTLFYPHMVPAPPEPVCFEFTVGAGITEPIQTTSPELSLEVHDIVTDNFTLSYALTGTGELAIYDIMGHMIWRKGVAGSGSEKIECTEWRSGVYFARIRADGDRIVRRLIIIR